MGASVLSSRVAGLCMAVVLLCTTVAEVQAWGEQGNRLIGHIARDLLSPKARQSVRQLMGSDDLATFSLYLDQHQEELDRRIPGSHAWHFDDAPIGTTKPSATSCPQGTCASTQIPRYYGRLADSHEPKHRKPFAVLVLTHLLADMHQPLHAADHDDRGGNQIKVRLPDGRPMNLHAAWDTSLAERLFGRQNELTVAKRLEQKYASRAPNWPAGTIDLAKIQAWVQESHQLAKEVAYGQLPGFACGVDMAQTRSALSDNSLQDGAATVEEQRAKAGYRLAAVLNRALGN
jgi:S1/P1 Nuclease